MAGKTKKVKFMDSSLINNDVLRPWTIDVNLDSKLQQEAIALEKILSFTTPQKFAGTLASSVLDATPMEYKEFKSTLELKTRLSSSSAQNLSSTGNANSPLTSGKSGSNPHSQRSNQSESSRVKESITEWGSGFSSGNQTRMTTPSVDYQDCFDEADMAYIERVKKSMYDKSMRRTKRAQTAAPLAPLQGIRYSQGPFGPISPNKSKLMLTAYGNPKLKPGMNSKIISSHLGHEAHN